MGVVIGGGAGGLLEAEAFFSDYLRRGGRSARFSRLAPVCCASTANHLATKFGLWGPKTTLMTACSSGATAIGLATGSDPHRRRPGDDRGRNGAALPADVCLF